MKLLSATWNTEGEQTQTIAGAANLYLTGSITIDVASASRSNNGLHLGWLNGRGRGR